MCVTPQIKKIHKRMALFPLCNTVHSEIANSAREQINQWLAEVGGVGESKVSRSDCEGVEGKEIDPAEPTVSMLTSMSVSSCTTERASFSDHYPDAFVVCKIKEFTWYFR